jgi:hypothetical protein
MRTDYELVVITAGRLSVIIRTSRRADYAPKARTILFEDPSNECTKDPQKIEVKETHLFPRSQHLLLVLRQGQREEERLGLHIANDNTITKAPSTYP